MTLHMIDEVTFAAILELAVGNPHRTPRQHRLLVEECCRNDNVFVTWSTEAAQSWLSKPCEGCGEAVQHTADDLCWDCYVNDLVDDLPGLATP